MNRNTDDFETWYKYDVEYIENWNLLLDLKIIFYTIPAYFQKRHKRHLNLWVGWESNPRP